MLASSRILKMIIYELFLNGDFQWTERETALLRFVSPERQNKIQAYRFSPDRMQRGHSLLPFLPRQQGLTE